MLEAGPAGRVRPAKENKENPAREARRGEFQDILLQKFFFGVQAAQPGGVTQQEAAVRRLSHARGVDLGFIYINVF